MLSYASKPVLRLFQYVLSQRQHEQNNSAENSDDDDTKQSLPLQAPIQQTAIDPIVGFLLSYSHHKVRIVCLTDAIPE